MSKLANTNLLCSLSRTSNEFYGFEHFPHIVRISRNTKYASSANFIMSNMWACCKDDSKNSKKLGGISFEVSINILPNYILNKVNTF